MILTWPNPKGLFLLNEGAGLCKRLQTRVKQGNRRCHSLPKVSQPYNHQPTPTVKSKTHNSLKDVGEWIVLKGLPYGEHYNNNYEGSPWEVAQGEPEE